ncbi:hypothetical protein [Halarcobacter sp.]|uniref:hypothetical protein n=1 Tax=Halarcobacter sp. TaxID=2321133 RepID=UPI003A929C23
MKKTIILGLVILGFIFTGCDNKDKKEISAKEEVKKAKDYISNLQNISKNSENHKKINLEK